MEISIIAAMGDDKTIGLHGKIPWHLPADFKHFKEITIGHPVIMGRKTFESIGKPLPGRANIVITSGKDHKADNCLIADSLENALDLAGGASRVFIIGGEQVYKAALPRAGMMYLTKVHGEFGGDAFFPEFNEGEWRLTHSEEHRKDEKNPFDFTFCVYERK